MRKQLLIPAMLILATGLLQGCNQQDTAAKAQTDAAKAQADIAKAQADGQKKIVDAQAKLDQVVAQNNKNVVGAQADAQTQAVKDPNAPPPPDNADVIKAHNVAENKVADAQYDVDKAKAEADKEVADARCKTQAGAAHDSCVATAKAAYDSAVAAAKEVRVFGLSGLLLQRRRALFHDLERVRVRQRPRPQAESVPAPAPPRPPPRGATRRSRWTR